MQNKLITEKDHATSEHQKIQLEMESIVKNCTKAKSERDFLESQANTYKNELGIGKG